MTYPACYPSQADYTDWARYARTAHELASPCMDCTKRYRAEMTHAGRCDRKEVQTVFVVRPPLNGFIKKGDL